MKVSITCIAAAGLLFNLAGCEPATSQKTSGDAGMTEEEKEIEAALSQLSPGDRNLAEQQKTCPVTEEPLGSMGVPEKITVEGKQVFICCASCEDTIRENPGEYLEKIGD